jgi:hypothetical protein
MKDLLEKAKDNADVIGGVISFVGAAGSIPGIMQSAQTIMLGGMHLPDPALVVADVLQSPAVRSLAGIGIGAFLTKEAGIPYLSQYADPLIKLGLGVAGGIAAGSLLFRSTNAQTGSYGPPTSNRAPTPSIFERNNQVPDYRNTPTSPPSPMAGVGR